LWRIESRQESRTYVVTTSNELQKMMDSPHSGLVFVECVMEKYDAPIDLILGGHAIADTDYGARGPQSAVNAQMPLPTRLGERNVDSPADRN
jgi:indolepyruvate decarboxylase